jgi:hypothetical protein
MAISFKNSSPTSFQLLPTIQNDLARKRPMTQKFLVTPLIESIEIRGAKFEYFGPNGL